MNDQSGKSPGGLTERKELEIYRRIFYASPDYIAFSRLSDGTYIDVNPGFERLLGFKRADVIGRTSFEVGIWPETGHEQRAAYAEQLKRDGMVKDYPGRLRTASGDILDVEASANILEIDGEMILVAIVRDVTRRKRTEEALLAADKRKDEFLAMLAHELRNPLAPISAAAQLLKLVQLDEARVRQTSEVIARQVEHMTSLIDDLLDVSRVTGGLVVLEKESLDIKNIVADAVEQVRPLIEARRHHLILHLPPESAHVLGDHKRLVQVVANLLNNAAKYTPEGGNIQLRIEAEPAWVALHVVDDGIGIPPELQSRIFDLFTQAERSSDRSQGGLGLGLALVKSLVELHGGNVAAYSKGPGTGCEFTVRLPRVDERAPQHASSEHGALACAPARALRLMLVDDNADAAQILAMFLEAAGHTVFVEHGSRAALERARVETLDACLLDIGLPEIDGNQLARRLRALPHTAQAVLIAITGYGQTQDRDKSIAAGFNHYFVKPVDTARLADLLAEIGAC
jgi:PAS domain S-box-containing protein